MNKTLTLLICTWFLFLPEVICQRFHSINDDFPFARSLTIYQDDFGFIWYGTTDGLVKYNGYEVHAYRKLPGDSLSLPGEQVSAILQTSDSLLLLGFYNHGLASFNRHTGKTSKIKLSNYDEIHVHSIIKDRSETIWIGTNHGLFEHDGNKVIQHYHNSKFTSLNNNHILNIFEDKHANLWVGTLQGINLLDRSKKVFKNVNTDPSFPWNYVMSIDENSKGEVFVSIRDGQTKLFKWNQKDRFFTPIERFKRDGEFSLAFDANDDIWLSSHGRGVYHVAGEKEIFYSDKHSSWHGLKAMFTNDIFHDRFHNIWIESDEVYKFPGSHKKFHSIDSEQFQVISVFGDRDYIWYCSNEPYRWSKNSKESQAYLSDIDFTELVIPNRTRRHKRIYQYKEWKDHIVFTSIRNLFIWNRKTDSFREIPTTLQGAFREFIIDDNNQAWVPGDNGNPAIINLETGEIEYLPEISVMKSACVVNQSEDGTQWWGTHNHGLFSYNPKTKIIQNFIPNPAKSETSISSFSINDVLIHSDGTVWVGTKFGLNKIDPKTLKIEQFNFDNYISNTNLNSILEDDKGALWIGTENGLINFDPKSKQTKHYSSGDGLINTNFTPRACYKDQDGTLYFGGNNGVDYFDPSEIQVNDISPELYLGTVKVNGKQLNPPGSGELMTSLRLKHTENFIDLEMVGLHYVAPNSQEYSYKIKEESENWISLGNNRNITLARLSPGRYTIIAKCANPDGFWSESKELLTITITPPFWQTNWFIAMAIVLFALIAYLIYKRRIKQIRDKENLKTKFNKRIAEIEMKALRAQMNPHFLFNSLNSIRLLIDKGESKKAKSYLNKYSQLIRQILNNSKNKTIRLDEEIELIRLYLDLEKMRFKNFSYSIKLDNDVEADFIEIPPLLMQPYVENAIWHGLLHKTTGEKKLDIQIGKTNGTINIVIEDNGIGRRQSMSLNAKRKNTRESLGLKMSEDRLKFLNDFYGQNASVEIIDLENPSGTKVVLKIPILD